MEEDDVQAGYGSVMVMDMILWSSKDSPLIYLKQDGNKFSLSGKPLKFGKNIISTENDAEHKLEKCMNCYRLVKNHMEIADKKKTRIFRSVTWKYINAWCYFEQIHEAAPLKRAALMLLYLLSKTI